MLTPAQAQLLRLPRAAKVFLEGPAGGGKTTAGVQRLLDLLASGIPGETVLLLAPQRTLATPYLDALNAPEVGAGGVVNALTVGGLAQRLVELFWPLAAEAGGFARPDEPPTFLTLETAQYYLARLVDPLLQEGYFDAVTIPRHRLYSQILDNLNKAAVVGFDVGEIGARLKAAWVGELAQGRVYDDAQDCATRFRAFCLANNLLDFSLQLDLFRQHLWPLPAARNYLTHAYRHLIYENVEEDTPLAHDLLRAWLPEFDSALLIYDREAGYRRFLGADPQTGYALKAQCDTYLVFEASLVSGPGVQALAAGLAHSLAPAEPTVVPGGLLEPAAAAAPVAGAALVEALTFAPHRFFPQMLDWAAEQIADLVHNQGLPPGEIAVLAPFLSDALRFALSERLQRLEVPVRSHRPSRALREEPAAQCLLTLAALAHPQWGLRPSPFDVAYALLLALEGLDLVRAQLLVEIVYRSQGGAPLLQPFERLKAEAQERITYVLGARYEGLREWLSAYAARPAEPLDIFFSRLFGELLSQPGYGFHRDYTAGGAAANLVESAHKFRRAALSETPDEQGREYLALVQEGVVAAQYLRVWQLQTEDAVFLAPAYTFLMNNRPVDVQFWLDVGGRGWSERLYQPLTQPYVLSREWAESELLKWTDAEEYAVAQAALYRLALGLLRRCRRRVYLGLSELGEQGYEQSGPLLKAFQATLQRVEKS
jgi:hypothetical protein